MCCRLLFSKEGEVNNMETKNHFTLNDKFREKAKIYQTNPVLATRYEPGMEDGWVIHIYSVPDEDYEALKFFETKEKAMAYVESNEKQYVSLYGKLVEVEVKYDLLEPVLHHKLTDPKDRAGEDFALGEYALLSDESNDYDFYILNENSWIILNADGNVRVWDKSLLDTGETFFGNPYEESIVYEKHGEITYTRVDV